MFSLNFSKETVDEIPFQEKVNLALCLENTILTFSPFLEQKSKLSALHHILSLRKNLKVNSEDVSMYQCLAEKALCLLLQSSDSDDSLQILCNIFENSITMLNQSEFSKISIEAITKCKEKLLNIFSSPWCEGNIGEGTAPTVLLTLFETALTSILSCPEIKLECLTDESMHNLILRLASCSHGNVSSRTMMNVFPKLMAYEEQKDLMKKFWDLITSQVQEDNGRITIHKDGVYMLLCSLAEYYMPSGLTLQDAGILHEPEFWSIIQLGVVHPDQVIRKQARYLMKRALDVTNHNNLSVNTSCFIWNSASSLEVWESFFLVIESLEEKQVHLIKPIFPIVEKLFKNLHISWALCALHRVIRHDNNFIVKWGLNFFLQLPANRDTYPFIFYSLLPALNNTVIYYTESNELPHISLGLKNLFESIANQLDAQFFKLLLAALLEVSWAPVPLYHVTQALGSLPVVPAWDNEDLSTLQRFLMDALATQSVYLRATSQSMLLRAMFSLTNVEYITLPTVASILVHFNNAESLKRGHRDWELTMQWLIKFISPQEAQSFVIMILNHVLTGQETPGDMEVALSVNAIARIIVLLCDTAILPVEVLTEILDVVTLQLDGCATRLYANHQKVDSSLELLTNLVEECGKSVDLLDRTKRGIASIVASVARGIQAYLHIRLSTPLTLHDFHALQLYVRTLNMLSSDFQILVIIEDQIPAFTNTAITIIEQANTTSASQKYFAAQVLKWESQFLINYTSMSSTSSFNNLRCPLEDHLVLCLESGDLNSTCPRPEGTEGTRDLQTLWGHIVSGLLKARWDFFSNLLLFFRTTLPKKLDPSRILAQAAACIELGGPDILPPIMGVLKYFIYLESDTDIVKKLIKSCYILSFERRKTELFWIAIKQFIPMAFSKNMLERKDLHDCLIEYVEDLYKHGQVVTGLYNLLVYQVVAEVDENILTQEPLLCLILTNGLLFGPVLRKDQRTVNETCLYIESLGDSIPANALVPSQCRASTEVRAACVSCLVFLISVCPSFLEAVARELLLRDKTSCGRKARYFSDSHLHRTKQRAAQSLLVIEKFLPEVLGCELLEWCCGSLVEESHQPSVRYMLEWLIVRILLRYPQLQNRFLVKVEQASCKRQGSMSSFISVLYHWVQGASGEKEQAQLADTCIQLVLPWTMAQHYNLRLYAQVVLLKICSLCEENDFNEVNSKYKSLHEGLKKSLGHSSGVKNTQKLQEDFYFSVFKPISHFSLETIFYELPRLANVIKEEWISVELFSGIGNDLVPIQNNDTSLQHCHVPGWVLKSTGGGEEEDEEEGSGAVIQRKVTPWKSMFPEQTARAKKRDGNIGALVVVASLIDRAPNLGGLSRTCEVMSASELVLNSLKAIEDPLFQSLSVSAEKWLKISEVKPPQLPDYLVHMKRQGYTLVAAEQTSNSVPLNKMEFPKKSLLLLGNEKEGIPAELLPLLDVCVEVPQNGVIRSLNVHVTGAIFIWQYFQQHFLQTS